MPHRLDPVFLHRSKQVQRLHQLTASDIGAEDRVVRLQVNLRAVANKGIVQETDKSSENAADEVVDERNSG